MNKFIFGFLIVLSTFNVFAKGVSIQTYEVDVDLIQHLELLGDTNLSTFDNSDKFIHFAAMRVLHFPDGSIFICPHNAVISSGMMGRLCIGPDQQNAWMPLMVFNVEGFEVVGIRFTFAAKGDIGLMVYFRKK